MPTIKTLVKISAIKGAALMAFAIILIAISQAVFH